MLKNKAKKNEIPVFLIMMILVLKFIHAKMKVLQSAQKFKLIF